MSKPFYSPEYHRALAKLRQFGLARDRVEDRTPRRVVLTDDEAVIGARRSQPARPASKGYEVGAGRSRPEQRAHRERLEVTTMKRTIVLPVLFGALIAAGAAPVAHATPAQDSQYVKCVSVEGLWNSEGPDAELAIGRAIVYDITMGVRTPRDEAIQLAWEAPHMTQRDANVMVNCATEVWLGFGAEGPHGGSTIT